MQFRMTIGWIEQFIDSGIMVEGLEDPAKSQASLQTTALVTGSFLSGKTRNSTYNARHDAQSVNLHSRCNDGSLGGHRPRLPRHYQNRSPDVYAMGTHVPLRPSRHAGAL